MSNNNITKNNILTILISAILLVYVLIRAYTLSFTHDESLSYTLIQGDHTWGNTANNHLLNTLFMSLSKALFGTSEFSLRLPNVILFIVYLIGCFFIVKRSKKIWVSLFGLTLILLNPFLIEFFSLARGYGLSLGFMLLSIYFMLRNKTQDSTSSVLLNDFILTSLFTSLAIYANLTIINFSICVLIIFSIKYWLFRNMNNTNSKFNVKFWSIFIISTIPILLGIIRLWKLKEAGELYYGASSLIGGFDSLISSSIYFKEYTSLAILTVKILIVLFLSTSVLFVILKKKYNGELSLITILIILLAIGLFFEDVVFGAKYPTSRTALFYIPIIAIFIYHLFLALIEQYRIKTQYYAPFILCLVTPLIINFVAGANFSYTTTWKYDAHTKDVMKVIKDYTQDTDHKKAISNQWLFEPTINYYISSWKLNLNPANRKGIDLSSDFIYSRDDITTLDNFKVVNSYNDIKSNLLIITKTNKK